MIGNPDCTFYNVYYIGIYVVRRTLIIQAVCKKAGINIIVKNERGEHAASRSIFCLVSTYGKANLLSWIDQIETALMMSIQDP